MWKVPSTSLYEDSLEGFSISYRLSAGFADDEALIGMALGTEFTFRQASISLEIPLYASVWSFAAQKRTHFFAACAILRCDPFLDEKGDFQWTQLSQMIRGVRLGNPENMFYLRAGPYRFSLGSAQLIDDYISSPSWNRRSAGAYLKVQWPHVMQVEAMTTNVLAPQELSALSFSVQPAALLMSDIDAVTSFFRRLKVGATFAADLTAPGVTQELSFLSDTQPLAAVSLYSLWPLLSPRSFIQVTPILAASAMQGFGSSQSFIGQPSFAGLGFGTRMGADFQLRLPYVAFTTSLAALYDTENHRSGLFGAFYRLERAGLVSTSSQGNLSLGMARPVARGWGGRGVIEMQIAEIWRVQLRGTFDPDVARHEVQLSSTLVFGTVLFRLAAQTRPLQKSPQSSLQLRPIFALAAEAQWGIWGPVSLFANVYRLPNQGGGASSMHVFAGVAGRFVLGMRHFKDWF